MLDHQQVVSSDAFKYHFKCWRFLGVYPVKYFRFIYVPVTIIVVTFPLSMTAILFYLDSLKEILANVSVNVTFTACIVKYINVLVRRDNILEVNDFLRKLDNRANSKEEQEYLRKTIRTSYRLFYLTAILFSGAGWLSELGALFSNGERLLYPGWFPLDWKASILNYFLAHVYQFIAVTIDVIVNITSDTYPAVYMLVLTSHLRALNMRVRRVGFDSKSNNAKNCQNLVQCIKDHQLLFRYFRTVQTVTSVPIFFQFFVTGIEACIAAVYIFFVKGNFFDTMFLIVYFCCVILEIFLYCYFGNELINESFHITEAIYSCNWVDQDHNFKKIVIIFMQSTQKSLTIMAGGFVAVSSSTFISVLRSSYSLFAVLMRIT